MIISINGGCMDHSKSLVLELAKKELAEKGTLDISVRRKLWEAMGPLEPRKQDCAEPRTLTEPLKKRAELALACARKVSRIWCAYDAEDKRPQRLIRQTRAYLDGKISVDALEAESDVISDFMSIVDEDGGDSAPAAAVAAWDALVVALEDESLLEPWCADVVDADLDPYDWDAAKNAVMAWRDADTDGDSGKQAVREMKFWAWYLKEAAKLLGEEGFCFPKKYIKAFAEKQNPPRPVPEEVTLESFAEYLGGRYRFHTHLPPNGGKYDYDPERYTVELWMDGDYGICPKCKKRVTEFGRISSDCCLWDVPLPENRELQVNRTMPCYHCPDHPDVWWIFPDSSQQVSSYKEALKRYLKGSGRVQAFLEQLDSRLPKSLEILGALVIFNGRKLDLEYIDKYKEKLGLADAGWVDREMEAYAFDVRQFLPHLYIQGCTFEEFLHYYPERVQTLDDGSVELEVYRLWARFWLDGKGAPVRVALTTRFFIWMKSKAVKSPALPRLLEELKGLTSAEAEEAVKTAKYSSGEWELAPLSGLDRREAIRLQAALEAGGVECRILPAPI